MASARDGIVTDYRSIDNSLYLFMNLYFYLSLPLSLHIYLSRSICRTSSDGLGEASIYLSLYLSIYR